MDHKSTADKLSTSGHVRVMSYGRITQEKNTRTSQLMLKAAGMQGMMSDTQNEIQTALSGLGAFRPKSFFQRLVGLGPVPLSAAEMKEKIDDLVAKLTMTEVTLHKNAKVIDIIATHVDEVAKEFEDVRLVLETLSSEEFGAPEETRNAAKDRMREIHISAQVTEQMRLSLLIIKADVMTMKERNRVLLDEHVPLWDKLSDALIRNETDAETASRLRSALSEAKTMLSEDPENHSASLESRPEL